RYWGRTPHHRRTQCSRHVGSHFRLVRGVLAEAAEAKLIFVVSGRPAVDDWIRLGYVRRPIRNRDAYSGNSDQRWGKRLGTCSNPAVETPDEQAPARKR